MPGAGDLDRRIVIERATVTHNAFNEPVETWATYAPVWAGEEPVSDGERLAAGQVGSWLESRFTFRSSPTTRGIKASDRVQYDEAIWSIVSPPKPTKDGRNRYLEMKCRKDADL